MKIGLFAAEDFQRPVFSHLQQPVSQGLLLANAQYLVETLPPGDTVLNLCRDKMNFTIGFLAAMIAGRRLLLPATGHSADLDQQAQEYNCTSLFCDELLPNELPGMKQIVVAKQLRFDIEPAAENPKIEASQPVAIAFTSGTTGTPTPHVKCWGTLAHTCGELARCFGLGENCVAGAHIVATVPSQHMYGLEMTTMLMLRSAVSLSHRQPFYPKDIVTALQEKPEPTLVTTPVHLQALVKSSSEKVKLRNIVSATAPLGEELAGQAEAAFGCDVLEIYGCTEAGSIATRRTLDGQQWQLLPGLEFVSHAHPSTLSVPYIPHPVPLADQLVVHDHGFELRGRDADLLNVAGKRFSLAQLNIALQNLAMVEDAEAFIPDASSPEQRPCAVVVSDANTRDITAALAQQLDPAFVPRPLIKVDKIPRNGTGKVSRPALQRLLVESRTDSHD